MMRYGERTGVRRFAVATLMILMLVGLTSLTCAAEVTGEDAFFAFPEEYGQMLSSLPDALRSSLPQDVFSADPVEQATALERFLTPSTLLGYLIELLFGNISAPLSLLLGICGVLLLRALINNLSTGLGSEMAATYGLLCRLCFCLVLVEHTFGVLKDVTAYFEALRQLNEAYLPLMGAMYLSGGNVATAAVNQSTLVFSNALVNTLGGESVVPLFSICLALTVGGVLGGEAGVRLSFLGGKLKKWYTTALALTMLLLGAILAAQTTLAAKADSLGFRTVRFVVSSNIPLVGGGISEMLRSAATGVSWLRSLTGIGGVILLLSLLLPTVGRVLLCRWICTLGGEAAAWFGCPEEGALLSEIGSLYGYLLAVVSLCCMTFFFSLIILLRCAAAI